MPREGHWLSLISLSKLCSLHLLSSEIMDFVQQKMKGRYWTFHWADDPRAKLHLQCKSITLTLDSFMMQLLIKIMPVFEDHRQSVFMSKIWIRKSPLRHIQLQSYEKKEGLTLSLKILNTFLCNSVDIHNDKSICTSLHRKFMHENYASYFMSTRMHGSQKQWHSTHPRVFNWPFHSINL